MKKIVLTFICILVFIPAISQASGYLTPLGTGVEISKVQILGNGGMVIWLKDDVPQNPDNCTEKYRLYVKPDLPRFDAMLAVVLSAHAQQKEVGFWSSECSTNYFWGGGVTFPVIRDLWIN